MNSHTPANNDDGVSSKYSPQLPAEAGFLDTLSIAERLVRELCEPSTAPSGELNDLPAYAPNDSQTDRDVAGLLFRDFQTRSLRGDDPSLTEKSQRFPVDKDTLTSVVRRHDLLRSLTSASQPSMPASSLPQVGQELFGFRLRQQLGEGAFARVFLAEQAELAGRPVALKISDLSGTEPQTMAQLQHTHIVPIYSVHETAAANLRAVCMPYFGGASLSQVLRAVWARNKQPIRGAEVLAALADVSGPALGAIPEPRATAPTASPNKAGATAKLARFDYLQDCMWIVARLAEGLQHAHDRGVLHRDIKPSNILIGADGTPMLLDFNLAHDDNQDRAQVQATLGGTVAYMAPEHLRALNAHNVALLNQVDERSDIYGLGMVLFEMATGHNPFEQKASCSPVPILVEAMAAERARRVPSLRQLRADAPWGLESIVRKCLQPDPARRYQRAEQLAEDLDRLLSNRPLRYAPELSRTEQARKWIRRHPRLASSGLIAIAAAALLAGGAAVLAGTHARLTAARQRAYEAEGAEAREREQQFERGTLQALCLVNTHSDLEEHAVEGRAVCEKTLGLYNILDDQNWQKQPAWQRVSSAEQNKLSEDARELLLLLAGARTRLAGDNNSAALRDAIALLDRADRIPGLPPSAAIWHARADYLRQLGDADAAQAAQQTANSIQPTSAQDYYLLATADLQSIAPDRYGKAIRDLEQALRLDPRHYWSWMQKGLCHLQLGEHAQALADFGVCVGLWPEFAWGYFNRGFTFDQLGQKAAAVDDYGAALSRDGKLKAAILNRGVAELELGRYASALADFDALVKLGRKSPALDALRGQALEGLTAYAQADVAFDAAFAAFEGAPAEVCNQIRCAYGFAVSGRLPEKARQALDEIPPGDPKYPDALYGLGLLEAGEGHVQRAISLFSKSLEFRPGFEQARRFRAVLLARLGRLGEAEDDINMALQIAPKSGATLYAAACVMALSAQHAASATAAHRATDEAVRFLQQALDHDYGKQAASDPDLAGLQNNAEFQLLMRSMENKKQ